MTEEKKPTPEQLAHMNALKKKGEEQTTALGRLQVRVEMLEFFQTDPEVFGKGYDACINMYKEIIAEVAA